MSKMTSLHSLGLVLVEFEYEYQGRDGNMVSIKPNERYMLLAKTNDHWWHVCKDERAKPFYIPAKYVKELPPNIPSPLDFREPPNPDLRPAVSDLAEVRRPDEVTIRLRPKGNHHKTENRMSTFGVPLDLHEPPSYKCGGPSDSLISLHTAPSSDSSQQKKKSQVTNLLFGSRSAPAETVPDKFRVPSFSPADPLHRPTPAKPVELPVIKNLTETKSDKKSPDPESPIKPESESSSPEPLPSPESENIYESISDLNIDVTALTNTVPAGLPNPQTNISSSPPEIKTENENPTTAVYANVADLKKTGPRSTISSASTCSSPGVTLSPTPDSAFLPDLAGWQVHTDHDSGKEFYYHRATGQSSWSDPRSPHPGASMESVALAAPSPAHSQGSDWEQLLDEATGRHYYYNHTSKQTSWTAPESISPPPSVDRAHSHGQQVDEPPPLPEEDYPTNEHVQSQNPPHLPSDLQLGQIKRPVIPRANIDTYKDVPLGWSRSVEANGKSVFTSEHTHEQWIQSKDDKGKSYYYSKDGSKTQWALPEASIQHGQPALGNGTDQDTQPVLNNWRSTMIQFNPTQEDTQKFSPSHRRVASDYASDASSSGNSPESQLHDKKFRRRRNLSSHSTDSHSHHQSSLEKAGILNKTKIAENGKRLRKNWAQSWTVLHDGILTFHKDPKFTPAGMATKSTQIVPEYTAELKGATILWATKEKSSKKNVLELKTRHGVEFLIQYDTDSIIHDWHKIIQDTIKQLDHGHYSEDEAEETGEKPPLPTEREKKSETARLSSSSSIDTEQGRVRNKLRKFLQRRPTLQSVKEKGYIKDNVFGCHLDTLCHRENTTVPKFMEKCIRSVEKRGLKIDGIYRVSGNLAVIQKLRYKADHEEDLDLEDGQWEEIHVITGALKLFLRELPEPLFPYSFFDRFIAAIKMSDYIQKVSYIRDLVRNLPLPNHDTMEVLFRHLRKVIEHGESNRMSVQSMAIVFGPTLLRPQEESNITIHMVFQNQIVELILNEFNELFQPK